MSAPSERPAWRIRPGSGHPRHHVLHQHAVDFDQRLTVPVVRIVDDVAHVEHWGDRRADPFELGEHLLRVWAAT